MRQLVYALLMVSMFAVGSTTAAAQEREPNNSCSTPQDLGTISDRALITTGNLGVADGDFYKFTAAGATGLSAQFSDEVQLVFFDINCAPVIAIRIKGLTGLAFDPGTYVFGVVGGPAATTGPYMLALEPSVRTAPPEE